MRSQSQGGSWDRNLIDRWPYRGGIIAIGSPSDAVGGMTPVRRVYLYRIDPAGTWQDFGFFIGGNESHRWAIR